MEILFIIFEKLAFIGGVGFFGFIVIAAMYSFVMMCECEHENIKKQFKYYWILIPLILMACLPSIDDLWKVRIGLIKYELASPKNIEKGSEEIIRIAKKLECKYIGCEEKK